ncbi:MAG: flagellar filament capping protein FliD, partial [Ruminiclostridium sp.]|nr:flagellar filament capping protein FliD [Ruminiclostridium sp.]
LDTEAIVNALTATTKNKINTNERKVLKLQAQQEAYRSVITAFTTFQNKYFNMLNLNTCLKSGSLFNSYKGTLSNANGTNVNGVTVSSAANANEAVYNVDVHKVATQSTLKSASASGKSADLSQCTDNTQDYTMTVSVGSKTKNITFKGAADSDDLRANVNAALKDAFGVKNDGSGIVSMSSDGRISSTDQSAVTTTTPTLYQDTKTLGIKIEDLKTGNNTFKVTVGNETKTVSFSTVAKDYFDEIFDENGKIKDDADLKKVALFKEVALNERSADVYDKFKAFEKDMSDDDKADFAKLVWEFKKDGEIATAETRMREKAMFNIAKDMQAELDQIGWHSDGNGYETGNTASLSPEAMNAFNKVVDDYLAKINSGEIQNSDPNGKNYQTMEKYVKTYLPGEIQSSVSDDMIDDYLQNDEAGQKLSEDFQKTSDAITEKYEGENVEVPAYDKLSQADKILYYDRMVYTGNVGMSEEDYIDNFTSSEASFALNKANIENNLGALNFKDELVNIKADVAADGTITIRGEGQITGNARQFGITQSAGNATDFGLDKTDTTGTANQISTTAKLKEMGLTPNDEGKYTFSINGVDFAFDGDTTVSDMMKKVNASEAGVKMTYTTLTNQFIITSNEYGRGQTINVQDGAEGLMNAFGFGAGATFTEGTNTSLTVNGVDVETTSNSYTVDGTTFTFTAAAEGTSFTNDVKRDYSKAIDTIKSFVEDYNKLIDEIYGYVDDEPNKDYYFLTDDDKEEMDLSESQENKWDKLARKGLLYRDSTITGLMSKLRTAIYSGVEAADGKTVGLFTLGITTTSNVSDHGKLQFSSTMTDEQFAAAFEKYADEFAKLFNDPEKGIAYQFDNIINSGCKTSGDVKEQGVLVQKAGISGTSSATTNSIYKQIQSLKNTIATWKDRYEQQQERYWKIYSNMETMLGNINGQSSYIQQLMGSM